MIGSKEPIYQNLPVYDRMLSKSDSQGVSEDASCSEVSPPADQEDHGRRENIFHITN